MIWYPLFIRNVVIKMDPNDTMTSNVHPTMYALFDLKSIYTYHFVRYRTDYIVIGRMGDQM